MLAHAEEVSMRRTIKVVYDWFSAQLKVSKTNFKNLYSIGIFRLFKKNEKLWLLSMLRKTFFIAHSACVGNFFAHSMRQIFVVLKDVHLCWFSTQNVLPAC
jgi:hypothetical protein